MTRKLFWNYSEDNMKAFFNDDDEFSCKIIVQQKIVTQDSITT